MEEIIGYNTVPINKNKSFFDLYLKDFFISLAVLSFAAIIIYYVPILSHLVFFLFLFLIWYTKKDYLWLAIILIMNNYPGGLFHGGAASDIYRIPLYTIGSGVSFSFTQLYLLLMIIKSIKNYQKFTIVYKKYFQFILIYLAFLVIISFFIGVSLSNFIQTYITFINLSIYFSIFFIIRDYQILVKFFSIIFPYVFIAFFFQLYGITNQSQLIALLKPGVTITQGVLVGKETRPIEMTSLLLLNFVGSLLFIGKYKPEFNKNYLILINLLSIISIFMTGTRSWAIAFTGALIYFFITNMKRTRNFIRIIVVSFAGFFLIYSFFPEIHNQLTISQKRIATIEELSSGDPTAGGTLVRLTERLPKVMHGFWQSSIIVGAGFSNLFYKYTDTHVPYANILLNSGIIGIILLYGFIILIFKDLNFYSKSTKDLELKAMLKNSFIGHITILLLSFGVTYYGFYGLNIDRSIVVATFFAIVNVLILKYYDNKIKIMQQNG